MLSQLLVAKRNGIGAVHYGGMFVGMTMEELQALRENFLEVNTSGETPTLQLSSGEVVQKDAF